VDFGQEKESGTDPAIRLRKGRVMEIRTVPCSNRLWILGHLSFFFFALLISYSSGGWLALVTDIKDTSSYHFGN
jgi:hypothetical protein